MSKPKHLTLIAAITLSATCANAADFFDTSIPNNIFNIGARVGLNISNQTHNSDYTKMNLSKWGTGFDAGIVCDINIRNFLSIQPGLFFQSNSNDYAYIYTGQVSDIIEYGHTRHYTFTVPILASIKLHPVDNICWSIDLGPYFQYGIGGSDNGYYGTDSSKQFNDGYYDYRNKFDFGIKLGSGIEFLNHYYIGVHYLAGCRDVWTENYDGRNKTWTMTIGYDF